MSEQTNNNQTELKYNRVIFVQLNDVYHIDTSSDYSNDESFILPRIAALLNRMRNAYGKDRVYFCLPGDFLGPSCLSKQFKGEQMVDVLNAMGLDFVTFGNHEFEEQFTREDVIARIKESHFKWVSSNFSFIDKSDEKDRFAIHKQLVEQDYIKPYVNIRLSNNNLIVVLGLIYKEDFEGFGRAFDPVLLSKNLIAKWKEGLVRAHEVLGKESDGLTFAALTHQTLEQDIQLAKECPELLLLMGGHDHDVIEQNTDTSTLIVKTASNARTLRLNFIVSVTRDQVDPLVETSSDPGAALSEISGHIFKELAKDLYSVLLTWTEDPLPTDVQGFNEALHTFAHVNQYGIIDGVRVGHHLSGDDHVFVFSVALDTTNKNFTKIIPEDQEVRRRIKFWLSRSDETTEPLIKCPRELVVEDRYVRSGSTNFGNLIADIVRGVPPLGEPSRREADVGLINSGSFRLDRNIQENEDISKKILCDVFFHPNTIEEFKMRGAELKALLENSLGLVKGTKEGDGDFLQISGVEVEVSDWRISRVSIVSPEGEQQPFDLERDYTVATTYYVANICEKYKTWFEDKEQRVIANDIKSAVELALYQLRELGKLRLPYLPWQPEDGSLFRNYLDFNGRPRWKFKSNKISPESE